VLGVRPTATAAEIKAAYRALVKQHHPDAGGDATTILALNAAWEVLGDGERRRAHDNQRGAAVDSPSRTEAAGVGQRVPRGRGAASEEQLERWLQQVYAPIDRLLGQVIHPFAAQLKALAADPYDDLLMQAFCTYLEHSQARIDHAAQLFQQQPCPAVAEGFGLSLYHCFSLVKDALAELERYTMGYVDSYLHDGQQMLREGSRLRAELQHERRQLLG